MGSSRISIFFKKYGYLLIAFIAILVFLIYPNIGIYDWVKEILYCDFIKQSILDYKMFPMFMWNSGYLAGYPAVDQSAFFAGNPETLLFSPFLPLLLFLPSMVFLKLLVLIHLLIGWAGIRALSRTCAWNERQTRIFSALFIFSPIIIQHISIGYLPWFNLYFFPWLLNFLLIENSLKKWVGTSIVLALILLQGGLHVFVWVVFFLAFFSVPKTIFRKNGKSFLLMIVSGMTACFLALPRVFTSFQVFSGFEQKFFNGYSLQAFLKWGLIPPFFTPSSMDDIEFYIEESIKGVPFWDGSLFWGFLLVCVIALPLVFWYVHKKNEKPKFTMRELDFLALTVASALMLLLSFGGLYSEGISFISDLIHIPALKGMEKYPFRFAILSYFGFAFVTASLWEDIQIIFTRIVNQIRLFVILFWNYSLKFANFLHRKRKIVISITCTLVFICAVTTVLKETIMDWIFSQISLAYTGQGADFLYGLMEHTGSIPIERYLKKAEVLIGNIQSLIFRITIISVCLLAIAFIHKRNQQKKSAQKKNILHVPFWLMEVLVVLPLMVAFGMWWRVSFATPITSFPNFEMQLPNVNFLDADVTLEIPEMQFSPQTLEISASEEVIGKTLVFPQIPYNDTRFLKLKEGNGVFIDVLGKTALRMDSAGLILIKNLNNHLFFSTIFATICWIGIVIAIIRSNAIRKNFE